MDLDATEAGGWTATLPDDVDAAVKMDTVISADRTNTVGMDKSENIDNVEEVCDSEGLTPVDLISADRTGDRAESADAVGGEDSPDDTSEEVENTILESMRGSDKCESNESESDGDCTSERTCLEAMTPDGQDYYLRLGDSPRRRSALRLSRIIARQQLLRRLAQGSY